MLGEAAHILVVDDDNRLRGLLRKYLMDHGYRVSVAASAEEARQQLGVLTFDLMVLDRMMPGEDGLTMARSLRAGTTMPILMLTAMGEVEARIDGLEAGVDDYLGKPFEPRELLLRIQTILRRVPETPDAEPAPTAEIQLGDHTFHPQRELLLDADGPVRLTTTEASLLRILAENLGRVMSRLDLARSCSISGGERTIDVQVTRLRRKIEPDPRSPRYLQTVRGRGYVLRADQ
ncbi:MAG: response regulator [Alphaproteobacteria bacterium]|nr:response regulator [Alphaproteobacteria bacterium]